MHFTRIVSTVVCFLIINNCIVKCEFRQNDAVAAGDAADAKNEEGEKENEEKDEEKEEEEGVEEKKEEDEDITPKDKHTFVALIDIVFVDATKRTCTGTVIHDHVAITAGHCFVDRENSYLVPDLTDSFIVLGTKQMFESGYEQYLPIEKVITHPKFRGWTADLALVYTFAGMTTDKPGKIIPLAGDKAFAPMDTNVTVLSWGRCKDEGPLKTPKAQADPGYRHGDVRNGEEPPKFPGDSKTKIKEKPIERKINSAEKHNKKMFDSDDAASKLKTIEKRAKKSRYLKSSEERNYRKTSFRKKRISDNETIDEATAKAAEDEGDAQSEANDDIDPLDIPVKSRRFNYNSYRNWRRQIGDTQNQLTVEMFGFVNVQQCKKIVSRTMPSIYAIKNEREIICYASEDRYITMEDSGAPAMQNGHLVAVTVGGVETDGDHIAVGMKMSCFCPWIADNLPNHDGHNITCCKNCCDTKHFGKNEHKYLYRRQTKGKGTPTSNVKRNRKHTIARILHTDDEEEASSAHSEERSTSKKKHKHEEYNAD